MTDNFLIKSDTFLFIARTSPFIIQIESYYEYYFNKLMVWAHAPYTWMAIISNNDSNTRHTNRRETNRKMNGKNKE